MSRKFKKIYVTPGMLKEYTNKGKISSAGKNEISDMSAHNDEQMESVHAYNSGEQLQRPPGILNTDIANGESFHINNEDTSDKNVKKSTQSDQTNGMRVIAEKELYTPEHITGASSGRVSVPRNDNSKDENDMGTHLQKLTNTWLFY